MGFFWKQALFKGTVFSALGACERTNWGILGFSIFFEYMKISATDTRTCGINKTLHFFDIDTIYTSQVFHMYPSHNNPLLRP